MFIFNCTKSAADFFTSIHKGNKKSPLLPKPKIGLSEEPILHDRKHWHWMVHVSTVGRRKVLLAIDTDSRFSMNFWGLRKGKVENFLEQFHHRLNLHLFSVMKMAEQDEATIEKSMKIFFEDHCKCAFTLRGDRSVQGHINDIFIGLEYEQYRWEEDVPTEEELFISDFRHNDTPRKRKQDKDYRFPTKELFHTWLSLYTTLDTETMKQAINQYQQMNRELLWDFPFGTDFNFEDLDIDEIIKAAQNDLR